MTTDIKTWIPRAAVLAAMGWGGWLTTEVIHRPETEEVARMITSETGSHPDAPEIRTMIDTTGPYVRDQQRIELALDGLADDRKEIVRVMAADRQEIVQVISNNTEAINLLRVQMASVEVLLRP